MSNFVKTLVASLLGPCTSRTDQRGGTHGNDGSRRSHEGSRRGQTQNTHATHTHTHARASTSGSYAHSDVGEGTATAGVGNERLSGSLDLVCPMTVFRLPSTLPSVDDQLVRKTSSSIVFLVVDPARDEDDEEDDDDDGEIVGIARDDDEEQEERQEREHADRILPLLPKDFAGSNAASAAAAQKVSFDFAYNPCVANMRSHSGLAIQNVKNTIVMPRGPSSDASWGQVTGEIVFQNHASVEEYGDLRTVAYVAAEATKWKMIRYAALVAMQIQLRGRERERREQEAGASEGAPEGAPLGSSEGASASKVHRVVIELDGRYLDILANPVEHDGVAMVSVVHYDITSLMSRICTLTLRNNILSDILPRHVMDAVEQQERASVSLSGVGRSGGQAITPGALTTPTTTSATPVTSMSSPNATFPADLTFAANAVGSSAASSSDPLAPSAFTARRNYAGGTRSLDANAAFSVNRPAWASISSRSFEAAAAGHASQPPPGQPMTHPGHPIAYPGPPIGPPIGHSGHLPPQKQASGLLSRSQVAMSPSFIMDNTAKSHEMVTMLFVDVVGFTSMADRSSPQDVMTFLNALFGRLDEALLAPSHHLVRKVETAGDCYIAAAGAVRPDGLPWGRMSPRMAVACASQVVDFACDVLRVAADVPMPNTSAHTPVRVGVHSGPCVSGSIGRILPKFSIFGDTINVTSRMESTAPHGRIQLSAATHALLADDPRFANRFVPGPPGGIDIKGKGRMDTYLFSG